MKMAVNPLSHRPDDPSSALLRRGQPPSKAERAYEALRDRIVMLRIHPGAPLLEEQLTSDLGVGRTPLREAFKRLELERLVVTYPRRGTFATDINITDLTHISEVRQELEPVGAALAARRATNHDRDLLTSLADQLESNCQRGLGPHALLRLDLRVHRSIYAATHNPYLEETLLLYDNLATRIWCMFIGELVGVPVQPCWRGRSRWRASSSG